jgi:carboxymethylenebutenolidase
MDQRIIDLYDRFVHGRIARREFMEKLRNLAGGTAAATALMPLLQNHAIAQTQENDARIATSTVNIAGVDKLTGYLCQPRGNAKSPAVIVIHENRGLNPHIRDVTRRFAIDGFLALGVDYLGPQGGTPTDEDVGRTMIGKITPAEQVAMSRAALAMLKTHPASTGKVGAVGYCWGGGAVNALAVSDATLDAGVPYYGRQAPAEAVANIKAPLMLHYAAIDDGINAGIPAYEAALKAAGKTYELYMYPGANHAFNNDTSPARYNKDAADLAWSRTIAFFRKNLGESVRS